MHCQFSIVFLLDEDVSMIFIMRVHSRSFIPRVLQIVLIPNLLLYKYRLHSKLEALDFEVERAAEEELFQGESQAESLDD